MIWKNKRKEDSDTLKRFGEMLLSFEHVIKTAERIYCSKCWSEMQGSAASGGMYRSKCWEEETRELEAAVKKVAYKEEQLQEAMNLMREHIALCMSCEEESSLQRGKVEGLEDALTILMEVME